MTNSTIHLQRGIERPLRDVDLAELLHLPSASPEAFRLRVRLDCVGFDGWATASPMTRAAMMDSCR
jgi:hypothetical protein